MLSDKSWTTESVIEFLMGLFAVLALVGLGCFAADRLWQGPPEEERRFVITFLATAGLQLAIVVQTGLFLRANKSTWSEAFGFRMPRLGWTMAVALAVGAGVFVVNIGLAWVCRWLMGLVSIEAKAQAAIETLRTTHSPAQVLLVGITAILLAPVAEEVLFRGILYPSIKQAGFPQLALWGSAVIFAATHANLMTFVPLTFFAIAQCLLYERTANLAAPIAAHSLFNIINFVWVLSER